MPVIQIPVSGGGTMSVDVDGFASEMTLQRVADLNQSMLSAMSSVISVMSDVRSQLSNDDNEGRANSDRIINAILNSDTSMDTIASEMTLQRLVDLNQSMLSVMGGIRNQDSGDDREERANADRIINALRNSLGSIGDSTRNNNQFDPQFVGLAETANRVSKSLMNLGTEIQGMKTSQLFNNITQGFANLFSGPLGNILGKLGGAISMAIGMLEKLGASFNTLRRVGIGFSDDMDSIRRAAANAGMQLDAYAALMVQNGATISSLGRTTSEGAERFSQLSNIFYQALEPFGNFGMNLTDINQLLLDEIEARRTTIGYQSMAGRSFSELTRAITDNIERQERMTTLTGEDLRARMAAQVNARQDARVRAQLIGATERLYNNFNTMASSIARFDPSGQLQQAIGASFATGFDPFAFAPELTAMLGPELQGILSNVNRAMSTMDEEQFLQYMESQLGGAFENLYNDQERLSYLTMMATQTADSNMQQAAMTALDVITSFRRVQERAEFQTQLEESDPRFGNLVRATENLTAMVANSQSSRDSRYNEASMMQAQLDRFGAALSYQFTNLGLNIIDGMAGRFDNDSDPGDGINYTLGFMRDVLMGEQELTGSVIGAFANLPSNISEIFSSVFNSQLQVDQLTALQSIDLRLAILNDNLSGYSDWGSGNSNTFETFNQILVQQGLSAVTAEQLQSLSIASPIQLVNEMRRLAESSQS